MGIQMETKMAQTETKNKNLERRMELYNERPKIKQEANNLNDVFAVELCDDLKNENQRLTEENEKLKFQNRTSEFSNNFDERINSVIKKETSFQNLEEEDSLQEKMDLELNDNFEVAGYQ